MAVNEKFPLALPSGTVLAGQYTIDNVLGQGGFGITYKATDYKTKNKVAIKEFFPDTLAYRENTTVVSYPGERTENYQYGKEAFLQEAKTLAEFIGCENIVRIHSYFEENDTAYFVMDYVEGKGFDEYLKEHGGKIGFEDAKRILIPIMDALSLVHSKGIIHRDVTPDNIFITNEGVVKLLDFGAARYSLGDKSRSLDVILKHGFAPKEQYTRRGKQGPYTDVYSLGATFYFALTGKRPPDSVERLDDGELIPPSSIGVQITETEEDAIFKALDVQPADRYQSMTEFKNALLNNQEVVPVEVPNQEPPSSSSVNTAPVKRKSKKPLVIVLIIVGVVFALVSVGTAVIAPSVMNNIETSSEEEGQTSTQQSTTQQPTTQQSTKEDFTIPTTQSIIQGIIQNQTTQQPTTQQPTAQAPTSSQIGEGDVSIIGNTAGNINNGGMVTDDRSFYTNGYSVMDTDKNKLFTESGTISNLIVDGNLLYYICNKKVCVYRISGNTSNALGYLSDYSADYMRLYMSKDYYFVYTRNEGQAVGTIYRVSRKTGKREQSIKVGKENQFIFFDKYLYYVDNSSDKSYVEIVSSSDFSKSINRISLTTDEYSYDVISKISSKLYVTVTDGINTHIFEFKNNDLELANKYNITDKCKELAGDNYKITYMNAISNQISLCISDGNNSKSGIYHLTINGKDIKWDTCRDIGKGTDGVSIVEKDNEYHFYYVVDGGVKYRPYDLNGDVIKSN